MGNTLDKPSLLMKRQFVRTTNTVDQVVKKGVQYAKHDMQSEVAESAHRRMPNKKKLKNNEDSVDRGEVFCGKKKNKKVVNSLYSSNFS
jgi:hypothetical protein